MSYVSVVESGRIWSAPGLVVVALFALAAWLLYRIAFAPTAGLPGPWYTKLSSGFLIYQEYQGNKRTWIHDLHLRYGPVVRLGPNEASFASASALKEIYISGGGLNKTDVYSLFEHDGHRNLFTALEKEEHKEKKKRFADRYSNTQILHGPIPKLLHDRANAFTRKCVETSSADVYFLLHCYALDCVTAVCFDPHGTRSIEGPDAYMVRAMSYHDSRRSLILQHYCPRLAAFYRWMTTPRLKGGSFLDDYAWRCINEPDVSPMTLAARLRTFTAEEMDQAAQVSECLDHIGAGIDTTGDTLCFLLYELSQPENAGRVTRLRNELRAAELADGQDSKAKTPFLDAVLSEALRLWAPGTLPLPRYVPEGGRIMDGYHLPAGTIVSCQSFTMHRYSADVYPEPETFHPERWLADTGAAERNRHLFAFGAGARMCIGKNLAMAEMRALLRSVYTRYETTLATDMHYSMEMVDQLMTSRPRDMCCKLRFQLVE